MKTALQIITSEQNKTETIKLYAILACTKFADDEDGSGNAPVAAFGYYTDKKGKYGRVYSKYVENAVTFTREADASEWLVLNKDFENNKIVPITL